MHLLSLFQIFGDGVTQDDDFLIIKKSSLLKLTSLPDNSPESLLVGILLTTLSNFEGNITDENENVIFDENNQAITFDNSDAFEFLKLVAWKPFQFKRFNSPFLLHQIIIFNYARD
jgi:hypothetical protein